MKERHTFTIAREGNTVTIQCDDGREHTCPNATDAFQLWSMVIALTSLTRHLDEREALSDL